MYTVVIVVDSNAHLPDAVYPGPDLLVQEFGFVSFHIALNFLRSKFSELGVMAWHIEDRNGERIDFFNGF
jgi:hypothetical protein